MDHYEFVRQFQEEQKRKLKEHFAKCAAERQEFEEKIKAKNREKSRRAYYKRKEKQCQN